MPYASSGKLSGQIFHKDTKGRIGRTASEKLAPAEHIKQVAKRLKSAAPKLELEERDAKGLIGKVGEE